MRLPAAPEYSGSKRLKPAKNFLPRVISRIIQIKFQQIHLISVSGHHCMHFIFKICETVAGATITSHLHDFSGLIFGRFLLFGKTVWQPAGSL